jgi:arsenite-transporting ATPase
VSGLTAAFDTIAGRRVILFGGKGGAGKTTISSIAALHFAQTRQVTLFTTDPASNLNDLFPANPETRKPGNPETRQPVNPAIEVLDARRLYDEFLTENLENLLEIGDRGTYLDREELRRFFELSLPGVDELMAWMRIGELAETNPGALVIVDTAPTGHTLRMLGAGDHFKRFAEALDALQAKHRGMVRQFMRRNVRDAIDEYITRFEENARRRRDLLTNASTAGFVPVTLSEPWVVEQTLRLIAEVREDGIDVPFTILNRAVVDADCERDRFLQQRDEEARKRIGNVVDAARSCVPLDSEKALRQFLTSPREIPDATSANPESRISNPVLPLPPVKLLFLAGKGGVGKTTCASSIALQLAQKNPEKQYTVISVDPAHALRDVFASEAPPSNLNVEIVDTRTQWQEFRQKLGDEIERAVSALTPGNLTVAYDTEALQKLIDIAPPGADELFAVSRLAELAADDSQQLVVVDTAPTGHFLRLLELPATVGEWVREFMRILLRYRELVPAGHLGEELVRWSKAMHSIEATLRSDRAGVIVVTRPERIVVAETSRLIESVEKRGMKLVSVIANYVTPSNDCGCDRSMRAHEVESLTELGREPVIVERRDSPVTKLADLAALFRVASD